MGNYFVGDLESQIEVKIVNEIPYMQAEFSYLKPEEQYSLKKIHNLMF